MGVIEPTKCNQQYEMGLSSKVGSGPLIHDTFIGESDGQHLEFKFGYFFSHKLIYAGPRS